ncbi:MAG: hypothetical protein Q4A06_09865 [Cardiobacteriaceae bacterium]|nr:hypothetical protein [Cardiobacteriaceae bacterium]
MKRLSALIALLLAGQALAVGTVHEWMEEDIVGIAYLGNHADIAALRADPDYPRFIQYYPGLEDVTAFDIDRGEEVYLVIPASDDIDIRVHHYDYDKEDGIGKELHHAKGASMLLRINQPEQLNTLLIVKRPDGETLHYVPQASEDGRREIVIDHIQEGLTPTDLSLADLATPVPQADSFIGITARVDNGEVIIDIDPGFPGLSNYLDTSLIKQRQHTVQGLAAPAKLLYISDIGQDSNPVLCIINANHDLEILDLFNAIRNNDWQSSGILQHDIHHFAHRSASYMNIYAVDGQLQEREIELAYILLGGEYHHQAQDGKRHSLYLSPDWKIAYRVFDESGKLLQEKRGHYRETAHADDYQSATYRYEFADSEGEFHGEAVENGWLIRGVNGENLFASSAGEAVRYTEDGETP